MLKSGTCCCYHCGSVFSASRIAFYDADTGQRWAERDGVYVPTAGDPGKAKATLLMEHGVPDQLDLNSGKTLHTKVCPSCGEWLAEGMGHYPIYNFLMCGLPGSGKTAFCEYVVSQTGRQMLKKLGLTISAPGKIAATKLTATQVGQTKQYRICVSDGKQTSYLVFWDVAGELFTNRRAQDARVDDKYCQLKRTLANLGAAVDGCLVLLDNRSLTPELLHNASAVPEDAETATDDFIQWLRLRFGKNFPLLFVFNKSDLLQRTLNDHSDCITTQSLLFKNAALSKRALAAHIALSQRFMREACCANTAPGDPCFTIQLGQPQEGNILSFDAAKNASLPLVWLLHHFKLCSSTLPD